MSIIDHKGNEFKSVKEMSEYWGVPYEVSMNRMQNGQDIEKALTTPVKQKAVPPQAK